MRTVKDDSFHCLFRHFGMITNISLIKGISMSSWSFERRWSVRSWRKQLGIFFLRDDISGGVDSNYPALLLGSYKSAARSAAYLASNIMELKTNVPIISLNSACWRLLHWLLKEDNHRLESSW
jgi:hypothetical protein